MLNFAVVCFYYYLWLTSKQLAAGFCDFPTTCKVQDAEEFVCMLYRVENVAKIDDASVKLFNKWKTLEALHPATDGLHGHIGRTQYQNLI